MEDNNNDPPPAVDEAEKARAEAEARRQRILAKSKERLVSVGDPDAQAAAAKTAASGGGGEGADASEDKPASSGSGSSAGAARMKAMRRRRFNKAKKAETTTTDSNEEEKQPQTTTTTTTESSAKEDATTTTETTTTETTTTTESAKEPETAAVETKKEAAETTTTTSTTEETPKPTITPADDAAPKKKYKGVAKMRREMLHKKKLQQEQEEKEMAAGGGAQQAQETPQATASRGIGSATTTTTTQTAKATTTATTTAIPLVKKKKVNTLPIFVHLLTIALLFLTGLDVGFLMFGTKENLANDMIIIDRDLAPFKAMEEGGLQKSMTDSFHTQFGSSSQATEETTEDEFSVPDADEEVENIDPLFRVDLDKLTRGQEGALYSAARVAIKAHRGITHVAYTIPVENAKAVLAIPRRFCLTPPIFFMMSLLVRQFGANILLGGTELPQVAEDDIRKFMATKKDGADMKNIMEMVKQAVMGFVQSMFPTAISLYNTWVNVRADMYMIMCGVLVGLALSTGNMPPDSEASTATTEGLGYEL